jgi:AcrR family transcriptional regulator
MATKLAPARDMQLIDVGIRLFGLRGKDGVGTREIARTAGRHMSSITYQFGGKDGLYLACAHHIAVTMASLLGAGLMSEPPFDRTAARDALYAMLGTLVDAMVRSDTAHFASFVLREQQAPTEAFEILYDLAIGPFLNRLVDLFGIIVGPQADPRRLRLQAIMLMGEITAFRNARAAVLKVTGWSKTGEAEKAEILEAVQLNLTAILNAVDAEPA